MTNNIQPPAIALKRRNAFLANYSLTISDRIAVQRKLAEHGATVGERERAAKFIADLERCKPASA